MRSHTERLTTGLSFALLLSASAHGQTPVVTLDQSFPESGRPRLQALANEVATVVAARFSATLLHHLPIEVSRGGPRPRTMLNDWQKPTLIRIRLDVNGGLTYAQFASQLGHELGHVMLGLYREQRAVGSLCNCGVPRNSRWACHSMGSQQFPFRHRVFPELSCLPGQCRAACSRALSARGPGGGFTETLE